jgi:hypothetical protein
LSPPLGLRRFWLHGEPLPVPMYTSFSSGSNVIESQAVPPPPASQYLLDGSHVDAAFFIESSSNGLLGSPGTVNQRHFCSPVCASYAVT